MQPPLLFTHYIIAGVEASLARVQAAYVVPETDRQQAWQILSFAFKLEDAWPMARALLLTLAPKMEMAGFREEWIPYLAKGLHCAQTVGDVRTTAECELQIGILHRLMSRFEEAASWLTLSIEHFAKQHDIQGRARALNELAWLEQLQHHYEAAERCVEQALALAATTPQICADAWRIKGMIAIGRRQWAEATDSHHQALRLFQELGDIRKAAWSMQNTGYALKELGELEEAVHYLQQAAATLQQLQDQHHLAIVWMNLASVFVSQKNLQAGYELFVVTQEVFERHGDLLNQAHTLTNQGIALLQLNEPVTAQSMFRKAAQIYQTLGDSVWYINALDGLVMALIASGQCGEAVQMADEAFALLPRIQHSAYYDSLLKKLTDHRAEAEAQVSVAVC